MSIGLFRKQISWLRLKYDGVSIPIPQSKNGYSPIVNRHRGQITAGAGSNAIKTIEKTRSEWGPDADRHAKPLIHLATEGALLDAY
jgi:hypothetical protein